MHSSHVRTALLALATVVSAVANLAAQTGTAASQTEQRAPDVSPLVKRSGKNTLVFDHRRLRTVLPGDGLAVLTADDGAFFQVIFECTAPNLFNYSITAREEFKETEFPASTFEVSDGVRVGNTLGRREVAMRHYAKYNRYRVKASLRAGVGAEAVAPGSPPTPVRVTPAMPVGPVTEVPAPPAFPTGAPSQTQLDNLKQNVQQTSQQAIASAAEAERAGQRALRAARENLAAERFALEAESRANSADVGVKEAETLRHAAEQARVAAETARVNAEQGRVGAERARQAAESARAASEQARAATEEARRVADTRRNELEAARQAAEESRKAHELARKEAESTRLAAEEQRLAAEKVREDAEKVRQAAERVRQEQEWARSNARVTGTSVYDCGSVDADTMLHPFEFDLWVETRPEWRFGAIAGVGRSGLANPRYAIRTNADGIKTFVKDAAQDSFSLDTLALANIYYSRTWLRTINLGLSFGIGSSGSAPRYFFGPSMVIGRYFVLHGGWALGSVAAPPVGQEVGAPPINGDNTLNALSSRVTARPYVGLGFTWVNRTQQFDEALSSTARTTGVAVTPCPVKLGKAEVKIGAAKGSAETLTVDVPDGCTWTAAVTSETPIAVTTKDKTITLTATQELKADVSTTLRVTAKGASPADVKVSVAQNCFTVNTAPLTLSTARPTGNVDVMASASCSWVVQWKDGANGGFILDGLGLKAGPARLDVRAPASVNASDATLQFIGRQSGAAGPVVDVPVTFIP